MTLIIPEKEAENLGAKWSAKDLKNPRSMLVSAIHRVGERDERAAAAEQVATQISIPSVPPLLSSFSPLLLRERKVRSWFSGRETSCEPSRVESIASTDSVANKPSVIGNGLL